MTAPAGYHVAHLNRGVLLHDWDDPRVAGFVDNLGRVNAIAERSPGFVWRRDFEGPQAPENDADAVFGPNPRNAYTISVWERAEDLEHFVHESLHGAFLRRRAEWFAPPDGPAYAVWPVAKGARPTLAEGKAALDRLAAEGPSEAAFDFAWLAERRAMERA